MKAIPTMKSTLRPEYLRGLKAIAKRMKPYVVSVSHLLPRAYCVAKPAAHFAVFAVPPQDREPQMQGHPWATVQNGSAEAVEPGSWHSLAYLYTKDGSGSMHVLPNQP